MKIFLALLILLSGINTIYAQTWNGSNPIWTLSNIGIGTSNVEAPLTVYGTSKFFPRRIGVGDARSLSIDYNFQNPSFISNEYPITLTTGGGNQPLILDAPRVRIGKINPVVKFDVQGMAHFQGAHDLTIASDPGTYLNWNQTGGWGETDFINHRGGGQGGFAFYNTYEANVGSMLMFLNGSGNLGLGTWNPQYKLDVIGTIRAREVKVDLNGADFVFEPDYKLMTLKTLEKYVKDNKHLPEVASAKQMEQNGTDLGTLNSKLL